MANVLPIQMLNINAIQKILPPVQINFAQLDIYASILPATRIVLPSAPMEPLKSNVWLILVMLLVLKDAIPTPNAFLLTVVDVGEPTMMWLEMKFAMVSS